MRKFLSGFAVLAVMLVSVSNVVAKTNDVTAKHHDCTDGRHTCPSPKAQDSR